MHHNTLLDDMGGLANLTSVGGSLTVEEHDALTSLAGLAKLATVGGDLTLKENDNLTQIDGLVLLTSVGGELVIYDTALVDIDEFTNVISAGGITVRNNQALSNLNGFANIKSVAGDLIIYYNPNLDGLSAFTEVGGELEVHNNDLVAQLDGLQNLTAVKELTITYNDIRCQSLVDALVAKLVITGPIYTYGNDDGCWPVHGLSASTVKFTPSGELDCVSCSGRGRLAAVPVSATQLE